jgi:hypothetical protein
MVFFAAAAYALEDAGGVLRKWRSFTEATPDEISTNVVFWSVPAIELFPPQLHGKRIVIVAGLHSGTAEEGEAALQPLREFATPVFDISHPGPYAAHQQGLDWALPKGGRYYWKSLNLPGLEDGVIDEIVALAEDRPTPLSMVEIWQLGGVPGRIPTEATAFGRRNTPFLLSLAANWTDAADNERCIAWARDAWRSMQRHSDGGLYLNFAGFGEEKEAIVRAGYGVNYDRLTRLKAKYDPSNLFHMNLNIRPAK